MAINNNCSSKQTFCEVSGQYVKDQSSLIFNYTPETINGEYITDDIWNSIIEEIIKIYNYGIRGTRNPINPLGITSFTNPISTASGSETADSGKVDEINKNAKKVNNDELIPLNKYNEILHTIGLTELNNLSNLTITAEKFNTIKNTINNLSLDNTRCNDCNTACNTSCQVNCDGDCYVCGDCYCYCYCQAYYNPWTGSYGNCNGQI